MKFISKNLEDTQKFASDFIQNLTPKTNGATVVGLYGNLGAGKTTLTQSIARVLGVGETVTSPTFVIEKIYELAGQKFTHLIHIDAYRIEKSEELLRLGWQEIISDSQNLILIEWPEKVSDIMPKHIKVVLKTIEDETSREIEVVF
jgi:tRNA threonylcarbamoyladenosine biosynthesis protein TsaE